MPISINPLSPDRIPDSFETAWKKRRQQLAQSAITKQQLGGGYAHPNSELITKFGQNQDMQNAADNYGTSILARMNQADTQTANTTAMQTAADKMRAAQSGSGTGAGGVAAAVGAGLSSAPNTTQGGGQATTALGKDYEGTWFYDMPQSSLAELRDDPEKTALLYSQYRNPGSADAMAASLGGLPDPESMMLAMGYNQPMTNNPDYLKKQQQLYDMNLGRGSGAPRYTDPLALISNVLADAATLGTSGQFGGATTELQRRFQAAGANPRAVATMVNQTIASSLFGLMPENSYNALMGQLARAQQEYDTMYLKEPGGTMPNYAQWVQSKLGLNLGM